MAKMRSYTKYENKIIPSLRQNLNRAESTEDVKKFFVYAVKELMETAFDGLSLRHDDIFLSPETEPGFTLSERILSHDVIRAAWSDSDMPQVLGRLAESALKRYRYLQKNPEKTEAKIRM
jgi:hypothetical protein